LRETTSTEQRQQIRWALLGFSGYAVMNGVSIVADALKWSTTSFGQQLLVEMVASIAFALAVIMLQLGLLIALLRFRLYDAEVVISRTVSVALVTVIISGAFAGVMEGIITGIQFFYPDNERSQTLAAMAGAIFAASCIEPVRDRVRNWTEQKFEKSLFLLRDDLPECIRDLRQTASLDELVQEVLLRIERGVRAVRSAAIVHGRVTNVHNVTVEEVERWRESPEASNIADENCETKDKLFPVRLSLVPSSGDEAPIGFVLVGPRPDGSIIGKDEQKTLSDVSETIARAIRNVIRREEQEAKIIEMITVQSRRLDEMEAAFGIGSARPKPSPRRA
jgi:hypothetical protein